MEQGQTRVRLQAVTTHGDRAEVVLVCSEEYGRRQLWVATVPLVWDALIETLARRCQNGEWRPGPGRRSA